MHHETKMDKAIEIGAAVALLAIALFGGAAIEWLDPGRIDERIAHNERQAELNEQHAAQMAEIARQISEYRQANPNLSRCDWDCIRRMSTMEE